MLFKNITGRGDKFMKLNHKTKSAMAGDGREKTPLDNTCRAYSIQEI